MDTPEAKDAIDKAIQHSLIIVRLSACAKISMVSSTVVMTALVWLDWLAAISAVSQQEKLLRCITFEKGDKKFNAGYFQEAFLAYDRVAIGIASFPTTSTGVICLLKLKQRN